MTATVRLRKIVSGMMGSRTSASTNTAVTTSPSPPASKEIDTVEPRSNLVPTIDAQTRRG